MNGAEQMELLKRFEDRGYPTDYILSRIRGKRALMVRDWDSLLAASSPIEYLSSRRYVTSAADRTPDGIWRYLLKEFGWVYSRMNRALLDLFRPFFLYSELRTMFICLRYAQRKESGKIERLLSLSLLSENVKKIFRTGGDIAAVVKEIEGLFMSVSARFAGIGKIIDTGLQEWEQQLTDRYLEYAAHSAINPQIKAFFINIVDARNILSLTKYLRLNPKVPPPFIRGGRISEEKFTAIAGEKDIFSIGPLLRELTGIQIVSPGAAEVENALYRNITRRLRKAARDPLDISVVLDYLWRCSIEARNLSILFHGGDTARDLLSAELIR